MIRVLHTGDWHIGQTLRGYPRDHEQSAAFDALAAIVVEQEVDALVVAGDVFDSQNPSGEAQRMFYELLRRLHRARPQMTTVLTAGNHDAAGRLEAPRALFEAINVRVVGNARRTEGRPDLSRHLVPLVRNGDVAAYVLALSYPTPACLPGLAMGRAREETGSPIVQAVRELYFTFCEAARPELAGLPLMLTGHLHVAGGLESEGAERRILIGGEHAVPPDVFPDDAAYVALGHLHRMQAVGRESIRYCGSLIPLSATELPYRHGVTLVTLGDGPARSEHIAIERPVAFHRVPATGDARIEDLDGLFSALGGERDAPLHTHPFVQVSLARQGLPVGFRSQVDRIAEAHPVRIVDVRVAASEAMPVDVVTEATQTIRLADRDPDELFRLAFARTHETEPGPEHLEVFHRAQAAC